jgi:hypothetical protein
VSAIANLIVKGVEEGKTTIEGRTLTSPTRIYTDGVNVTYGVDVDIGREGVINANGDIGILPLYNVPIASGDQSLLYAEIGSAVTLSKAATGQWQVVGFAKTAPGTYKILCVTVPQYCLRVPTEQPPGPPIYHPPIIGDEKDITIGTRLLTYEELGIYGIYGEIPYGATLKTVGNEPIGGDGWTYNPTFSWDALEAANGYYVEHRATSSSSWQRKDVGNVTSIYLTQLGWKAGQTTQVRCVAYWTDPESSSGRAESLHSDVVTYP